MAVSENILQHISSKIIIHNVHASLCHMLNSSRDTLLDLEPTSASVLKLAVATVLTVAFVAAMIAIFAQLHSDDAIFIKPRRKLHTFAHSSAIIPFFTHYSRLILESFAHLLFSKLFLNN